MTRAGLRTFTVQERRARLGLRHGLAAAHRFGSVAAAAEALVGLHASDPPTPYLSARARVERFVPADLESELYRDRTVTKHLCMRRTLFVVGRQSLPVVQSACTDRIAASERRRLVKGVQDAGIAADGARWLRSAEAEVLAALDELGPSTGATLARAVPRIQEQFTFGEGKPWGGVTGVSTRVFSQLAAEGRIRRGPPKDWTSSRHRWERTEPIPDLPAEADAIAELVRRWLGAFGPAPLADLVWWSGLGVTRVRSAVAAVGVTEVDLGGGVGLALEDDLEPVDDPEPWVAMLPALDPTAMGWKQREWYVGDHEAALFDRNGNIGPTVWADGRVVGGWSQGGDGGIRFRLLEDVGGEVAAAVDAEAGVLEEWVAGARVATRFPTPLDRELRAGD